MGSNTEAERAIEEAMYIVSAHGRRGFAWAPWVDMRYGWIKGVVKPMLDRLSPFSELPSVIYDAPQAGIEDYQRMLAARNRRRTAK